MGVNFAFGNHENFQTAMNAGIIPSDCFIMLKSDIDVELLFLDRDENLLSIVDRQRFDCMDAATSYISKAGLYGKTVSVFDGEQWRLFIVQEDGAMTPVGTSQKQSDWEQKDPESVDYIKNKPSEITDDEMIEWLNDACIVSPVASSDGTLYTTNNNEIYIL